MHTTETKEQALEVPVLKNTSDAYNTRYILSEDLPEDLAQFKTVLTSTLAKFKEEKVKGVYLDISQKQYQLIGPATEQGFTVHHAQDGVITLSTWIPEGKSRLPAYCSHYIGAGGLVIDFEARKVLIIREKSGMDTQGFKIPGGLVDVGEFISEASEREVFEETGVKANFLGVLALREKKNYYFGRNDIYFICLLEPVSKEISKCEVEVAFCEWVDVDDWVGKEFKVETQKLISLMAKDLIDSYHRAKPNPWNPPFMLTPRDVKATQPNKQPLQKMYGPPQIPNAPPTTKQ